MYPVISKFITRKTPISANSRIFLKLFAKMRVFYWRTEEYPPNNSFTAIIQLWWTYHTMVTFPLVKHFFITSLLFVHHLIFIRTIYKIKLASVMSEKEKYSKNTLET